MRIFLAALILALGTGVTAEADRALLSDDLRKSIHEASSIYHEKLRSYECAYSESTETLSNEFLQQSERRIIEDALGQIRLESTMSQVDDQGNVAATIDSIQLYNLRNEVRVHSQPNSFHSDHRLVTISQKVTITDMIRPMSYVMADGRPMHEMLDALQASDINIYAEDIQLDDFATQLIELSFAEKQESGDVLRHTYILDKGNNFMPLRQVLFFNKKRYRVLEPTFQEVSPGIHFPIKAVKFSYNKDSEDNELRSITRMSVKSIRINTEIPDGTFKLDLRPNDTVTDLRAPASSPRQVENDSTPLG